MKTRNKKLIPVVVRGCILRLTKEQAKEISKLERDAMREDWRKNQVN